MAKKPLKRYNLQDSPFYKLSTKKKLAKLLRTSPIAIKEILAKENLYVRKWKHKEKEEWLKSEPSTELSEYYRPIDLADYRLKVWQSRIADLLSRIIPPNFLFSPVKGRSYVDNAAIHKDSIAFWMLDIADYFPSCKAPNVRYFFSKIMKCPKDVTEILVRMTTWKGGLPQGAPCSPILAYFSNMNMWLDIEHISKSYNCKMSVYADDITFSSKFFIPKEMIYKVKERIKRQGLVLKDKKEASVIHRPATITGCIAKKGALWLPNKQHQSLFKLRHTIDTEKNPAIKIKMQRKLSGRLAQKKQIETANYSSN